MIGHKIQKDRRGLSLIELVCALAILSIITATIGGAMVVATHSYRQGTVESSLQQEAQFTANLIESLIVDATKSVVAEPGITVDETTHTEIFPTTTKLTIENENDVKYVIQYDPSTQKITYTEYHGESVFGEENELLAAHVSDFKVDARNFAAHRNVLLNITMKNEGSEYATSYNVTSRNNPNGGNTGLVAKATIHCEDAIVMEPGQTYMMGVSVSGSTSTYTAEFVGNNSTGSTATVVAGGLELKLGTDERAGGVNDPTHQHSPGFMVLRIKAGTYATKDVYVYLRYVDNVKGKEINGSGAPSSTPITVTLDDIGFASSDDPNLGVEECVNGFNLSAKTYLKSDQAEYAYVNAKNVRWKLATGADEYISVNSDWGSMHADSISFTITQQLPSGTSRLFEIYALHPNGSEKDGSNFDYKTNKDQVAYETTDSIVGYVTYTVPSTSKAIMMRGWDSFYQYFDASSGCTSAADFLRKLDAEGKISLSLSDQSLKTVKTLYRFKAKDDPDVDFSEGYYDNMWFSSTKTMGGGVLTGSAGYGEFGKSDFLLPGRFMYFMKGYDIEVCTGLQYQDVNGELKWYPDELNSYANVASADRLTNFTPSDMIVRTEMAPVSFEFKSAKLAAYNGGYGVSYDHEPWWEWVSVSFPAQNLDISSYTAASGTKDGLGSSTSPIPVSKMRGDSWVFEAEVKGMPASNATPITFNTHEKNISGTTTTQYGTYSMVFDESYVEAVDDPSFTTQYGLMRCSAPDTNVVVETATVTNNVEIWFNNWNNDRDLFTVGKTYKIVLNKFYGRGFENYNVENEAGVGEIYFRVVD
ncbi:MAG: prepilin-type N-terminal cleavage/methylation domain-containing protein [Lachnospiraceae bacterium]|nr:prepilin-type N-terminal cleavage/methylation domain-containing protein [Lachnospiraceae bacterium]